MMRLLVCLMICLVIAPTPPYRSVARSTMDVGNLLGPEPLHYDPSFLNHFSPSRLATTDPILFLKLCILRCDQDVKCYQGLLYKQERLEGTLHPPELIQVAFQEDPHKVRLQWIEGARKAGTVLYVRGENQDKALILPAGWRRVVGIVERDAYGAEARQNGRYPLPEFGIKFGMVRTLSAWMAAKGRDRLDLRFEGTRPVAELEGRVCHVFHRTNYEKPEDGGVADSFAFIDAETWLQTGSELRDQDGNLLAVYYFRQIQLNPVFPPDTFTREGMRK